MRNEENKVLFPSYTNLLIVASAGYFIIYLLAKLHKYFTHKNAQLNIEENHRKLQEILKQDEEEKKRRMLKNKEKVMKFKEVHELPGYNRINKIDENSLSEDRNSNNEKRKKDFLPEGLKNFLTTEIDYEEVNRQREKMTEESLREEEDTFQRVFGNSDPNYKGRKKDKEHNDEENIDRNINNETRPHDSTIANETGLGFFNLPVEVVKGIKDQSSIDEIPETNNNSSELVLIEHKQEVMKQLDSINLNLLKVDKEAKIDVKSISTDSKPPHQSISNENSRPYSIEKQVFGTSSATATSNTHTASNDDPNKKKPMSKYLLYKRPHQSNSQETTKDVDPNVYQNKHKIIPKQIPTLLFDRSHFVNNDQENTKKLYSRIQLDFINNRSTQSSRGTEDTKATKKSSFKVVNLDENDKETLYSLMGLVILKTSQRVRCSKIFSVEYFFEAKLLHNYSFKPKIVDKFFNKELTSLCNTAISESDLQNIFTLYVLSIESSIKVSFKTIIQIIYLCFRFNEINHACYFCNEMERYNYSIPREVLVKFLEVEQTKKCLLTETKNHLIMRRERGYNKYFSVNQQSLLLTNQIPPMNYEFLQDPEYQEFQWKKERYDPLTINKTLSKVNFHHKEPSYDNMSIQSKGTDMPKDYAKLENNFDYEFAKDNKSCLSDDVFQIKRIILQNSYQEYLPKNFKVVKKE